MPSDRSRSLERGGQLRDHYPSMMSAHGVPRAASVQRVGMPSPPSSGLALSNIAQALSGIQSILQQQQAQISNMQQAPQQAGHSGSNGTSEKQWSENLLFRYNQCPKEFRQALTKTRQTLEKRFEKIRLHTSNLADIAEAPYKLHPTAQGMKTQLFKSQMTISCLQMYPTLQKSTRLCGPGGYRKMQAFYKKASEKSLASCKQLTSEVKYLEECGKVAQDFLKSLPISSSHAEWYLKVAHDWSERTHQEVMMKHC